MDNYPIETIPGLSRISKAIHTDDEMFQASRAVFRQPGVPFRYYFYSGWLMADGLQNILRQIGRNPEDLTLLDFACGYGRITRFLASMFKEVRCSDLDQSMLDFNRENFGVGGFPSALSPDAVAWPAEQFDVVFSFSLFTHLPKETWESWFWNLFYRVKPNGLFVVTTRPATLARRSEVFGENDTFAFTPRNETRGRINVECYGSTTVSTAYVDSVIYQRTEEIERVALYPGGTLDMHQDTHIFRRKGKD